MSIEEKQTCNMHTREKEKSGTCCRVKEEQEQAEPAAQPGRRGHVRAGRRRGAAGVCAGHHRSGDRC